MASEKRTILRTVRITPTLDKWLQEIAENENRTVSNAIYNLLSQAIIPYVLKKRKKGMDVMFEVASLQGEIDFASSEDNEDN